MLRTHRAGKGPGGCGGWGLGSRNRRGPVVPPHPWSQRAEDLTWEPSWLPMPHWAGQMPAAPLLLPEGTSRLPLLFSPRPPSFAPRTNAAGGGGGGGGLGGQGISLGAQQAPCARVGRANALCSSPAPPGGPLPPASPDLPSLRGANPVWPPLFLPPQSPHLLPVHLGVPLVSLGIRVPHQRPAGALVVGRC